MKTTTPKKKGDNKIVLDSIKPRLPRIVQRGATHRSRKTYNRKEGKKV